MSKRTKNWEKRGTLAWNGSQVWDEMAWCSKRGCGKLKEDRFLVIVYFFFLEAFMLNFNISQKNIQVLGL